jgi:predicted protein tyrosine phosphatase
MIHVCSLSRLHETVETTGARHVVSLLARDDRLVRPAAIPPENHLWLQLHDISAPVEGYVTPETSHVESLIDFVKRWPRETPMLIHCYAGVSRSTAAAFVSVCALNPAGDEKAVAIALRRASPTATPNIRIVALADHVLGRNGRMVRAVESIGSGIVEPEAQPFRLELTGH